MTATFSESKVTAMAGSELKTRMIVGLEIHVQLATATKLFCACPVRYDAPPNSCTCEVCLGHPGSLPVMNRRAFDLALLTGLALNCEIARFTKWDRKSYYYPDMPKNYQISQYDLPLAHSGHFEFDLAGRAKRVRIRRAHLEEDAGKNIHDSPGCTLVDLNRAGTPLLEIVTEPDIGSAEEAYAFCVELQRLIVHLGVGEANMQKGQMRFEPNVNVAIEVNGEEFRTPIAEIKNLNSFRAVRQAIDYESRRQTDAWEQDNEYVFGRRPNENRGWDADRGVTDFQRGKEAAHDYRYFPDPDLVPVRLTDIEIDAVRKQVIELPVTCRRRLVAQFGLSESDADTIVDHLATAKHFERVIAAGAPSDIAGKQFVNVWLKLANDRGVPVTDLGIDADRMASLAKAADQGTISKTAANQLAEVMLTRPESPEALARELGLIQVQDADATSAWVDQAFAANEQAVRDALVNPKKMQAAAGFLRGQVMKTSGGKADPNLVGKLIEERLAAIRDGK